MAKTFEFTTEDVQYLTHGDLKLKLRLYKPRGSGPFPAVIDLHGGAWGKGNLEECKERDEALEREAEEEAEAEEMDEPRSAGRPSTIES